jgi:hypothetical protein
MQGVLEMQVKKKSVVGDDEYKLNTKKFSSFYVQVRRTKRRKPYLRYLWLDFNKTKTEMINHFKNIISTT